MVELREHAPAATLPGERLESVEAFASHVVLVSRADGHNRLRLLPLDALGTDGTVVDPALPSGSVAISHNEEFAAPHVVVVDESYLQPPVWSQIRFDSGSRTELGRREAPGHDPVAYVAEQRSCGDRRGGPDGELAARVDRALPVLGRGGQADQA